MATLPKIRVVVVEDHMPLRELTKEVLDTSGLFEVVGDAADGEEAVRVSKATHPDLVLLDLKMPGRDGFHALPELRTVAPQAKIVVYSMLQRDPSERRALDLGATMFVDKNVESGELISRLLSLFGREDGSREGKRGGAGPSRRVRTLSSWFSFHFPSAGQLPF